MARQKMLIRVVMRCEKCRSKALSVVFSYSGIESAGFKGDDKAQIELVGEDVDIVALTKSLRKKVGRTDVVSVGPVEEKKVEKNEPKIEPIVQPIIWSWGAPNYPVIYDTRDCYYYY